MTPEEIRAARELCGASGWAQSEIAAARTLLPKALDALEEARADLELDLASSRLILEERDAARAEIERFRAVVDLLQRRGVVETWPELKGLVRTALETDP